MNLNLAEKVDSSLTLASVPSFVMFRPVMAGAQLPKSIAFVLTTDRILVVYLVVTKGRTYRLVRC
jgi:hypothetical protein